MSSKKRKKGQGDDSNDGPAWLVSFTDMVTLLLAFFVLLTSFATKPSKWRMNEGRGSFQRAIDGFGLAGWLEGRARPDQKTYRRPKYPTEQDPNDPDPERNRDDELARIAEAFEAIRQNMDTEAADRKEEQIRLLPTSVDFRGSQTDLNEAARKELDLVAEEVARIFRRTPAKVYVIGMAPEEPTPQRQWLISAKRAKAAEEYLRKALAERVTFPPDRLESFGDGPGGEFAGKFDVRQRYASIVVAVMEVK